MGAFSHPITLIGTQDTQSETLDGLVDTGATFTSAPEATLERNGIRRENQIRFRLANGEVVEHAIGEVVAEMGGVRRTIICIFGPEGVQALTGIGAHTLKAFLLAVDPVEQRLIPTEALWL